MIYHKQNKNHFYLYEIIDFWLKMLITKIKSFPSSNSKLRVVVFTRS